MNFVSFIWDFGYYGCDGYLAVEILVLVVGLSSVM